MENYVDRVHEFMDRIGVAGPWFHRGLHGGQCPGALAELEAC
jgi:hypothetical protein